MKRQNHQTLLRLVLALQIAAVPLMVRAAEVKKSPSVNESQIAHSRTVALTGQRNFRDLGGYRTADGRRQVRWGKLYRSGSLARLTDQDYAVLTPLGISTIVDFRTTAERAAEPTNWRAGEPAVLFKSYSTKGEMALMAVLTAPNAKPADVRQAMIGFYQQMPEQYADQYSEIFHHLVSYQTPLLFHCTAGKDRTGLAAALILMSLGVSRADAVADYILTEKAGDFRATGTGAAPSAANDPYSAMRGTQTELMAPLLRADPAYLEAALDQIIKDYGSVQTFVHKRLGVSNAEVALLRARLLEPVS
jgi:protein-tyrosine phosphatase